MIKSNLLHIKQRTFSINIQGSERTINNTSLQCRHRVQVDSKDLLSKFDVLHT